MERKGKFLAVLRMCDVNLWWITLKKNWRERYIISLKIVIQCSFFFSFLFSPSFLEPLFLSPFRITIHFRLKSKPPNKLSLFLKQEKDKIKVKVNLIRIRLTFVHLVFTLGYFYCKTFFFLASWCVVCTYKVVNLFVIVLSLYLLATYNFSS